MVSSSTFIPFHFYVYCLSSDCRFPTDSARTLFQASRDCGQRKGTNITHNTLLCIILETASTMIHCCNGLQILAVPLTKGGPEKRHTSGAPIGSPRGNSQWLARYDARRQCAGSGLEMSEHGGVGGGLVSVGAPSATARIAAAISAMFRSEPHRSSPRRPQGYESVAEVTFDV